MMLFVIAIASLAEVGATRGSAQDHSTVVRVLRESRDFRARIRAAIALGNSRDPAMAGPLVGALSDPSAAVRAAACSALERLGNPEALPDLRRVLSDGSREVRDAAQRAVQALTVIASARGSGPPRASAAVTARDPARYPAIEVVPPSRESDWSRARHVVVLGSLENRSGFGTARLQDLFRQEVQRHLTAIQGVVILAGSTPPDAEREIQRRRLPRLRLEGSLNRVHRQARGHDLSVRCEVSLMLMDEPGRNIRASLNGAATGMGQGGGASTELSLAEQALLGAVRSAMSGASRAIVASSAR